MIFSLYSRPEPPFPRQVFYQSGTMGLVFTVLFLKEMDHRSQSCLRSTTHLTPEYQTQLFFLSHVESNPEKELNVTNLNVQSFKFMTENTNKEEVTALVKQRVPFQFVTLHVRTELKFKKSSSCQTVLK